MKQLMLNSYKLLKKVFPSAKPYMVGQKGFSLVEILVSIGVFAAIVFASLGVFIVSQESVQIGRTKTKAIFHMKDYIEKVKNIKRYDWTSLTNGRYLFADSSGNWVLQATTDGEVVDNYTRYIDIASAERDGNGELVLSGGTVDPSTKFISVTVSWTGIKAGSITESFYITRYLDNLPWELTEKVADFDVGTHSGTVADFTGASLIDGEIVLGSGGGASWCAPELVIAGVDLEGQGVAKAVSAIEGKAFVGTGENASGWTFSKINITSPEPPAYPVASVPPGGYFNDGGVKGNDVFGETNYGYVATDTNNEEVIILNTASTPYTRAGIFDAPGNTDAHSIYVYGNTLYVTTSDNKLYNVDVTVKTDPHSSIDTTGVSLNGAGRAVIINENYAYVATSSIDHQLQIINLTDPQNMIVESSVNLNAAGATDVFVNSSATLAYVVTEGSATQPELFIIDISNPSAPFLVNGGTYDTNGMSPRAVEAVPGGKVIVVGTGGIEYQVVSVSSQSDVYSIVSCVAGGGLNIESGIFDSASILETASNKAFTYIVTGESGSEFRIIEGGPGGEFATYGVWESETFDADHSAAFNRFDVTFDEPSQTDIKFQVAVVDPGISGTCADADFSTTNFVGPLGNAASFFQDDGAVPIDDSGSGFENPGQCARVRAYFETTDYTQSPTLYDVSINYSP